MVPRILILPGTQLSRVTLANLMERTDVRRHFDADVLHTAYDDQFVGRQNILRLAPAVPGAADSVIEPSAPVNTRVFAMLRSYSRTIVTATKSMLKVGCNTTLTRARPAISSARLAVTSSA